MSVPKSKRRTSTRQYIETARLLARDLFAFANRMPKRQAFRLANPLAEASRKLLSHVQAANRIYVKSDQDYKERKRHLRKAINRTDDIEAMLTIWYDTVDNPNDNVYLDFADRLSQERKLIQGVMRSDKKAFQVRESEAVGGDASDAEGSDLEDGRLTTGGSATRTPIRPTFGTRTTTATSTTTMRATPTAPRPDLFGALADGDEVATT